MEHAQVGPHRIAYRAWGDARAPPVVLVHGFVISSRYMVPLARELAPRWRVLAPDLPGFGRSSKPRDALGIDALADALGGFLDALALPAAHLVGNSMGCQVATALAERRPERVERLVLIGPTAEPGARTAPAQARRLLRDALRERPLLPLQHVPDYLRCGPRRIVQTVRHALADAIEERAPRVRAPTLVLRGERDPLVSPAFADALARAFPRGRAAEIKGSPHAGNASAPRRTAAHVEDFLTVG